MKVKNRIISAALMLAMTAGIFPAMPAFAEEEATLIPAERAGIEGLPEGGTYFTAGNNEVKVDEHGRYILTIYRDGDVSGENSVQLKTVDVSAIYGKDYIIDDNRYPTATKLTESTILERFADDDYLRASAEAMKEIKEKSGQLEEAAGEQAEEAEAEDTSEAVDTEEEKAPKSKSPLALMKEAQTGEET
ncbi:MAG: hypothetical protein IJI39_00120, partial [Clostridia bacterium]|nr:hypothetical protein [Clostridia bacterium]